MFRWLRRRRTKGGTSGQSLADRYRCLRELLRGNNEALELITDLEADLLLLPPGEPTVRRRVETLLQKTEELVGWLNQLADDRYTSLATVLGSIRRDVDEALADAARAKDVPLSYALTDLSHDRWHLVGGKAANLATLYNAGLPVPDGFALSAAAYQLLARQSGLHERVRSDLAQAQFDDPNKLEQLSLGLRQHLLETEPPAVIVHEIEEGVRRQLRRAGETFAVRSSAVGEDSDMTFAGLFDSRINVPEPDLGRAYLEVCASRFNARAVHYRLSAGVTEADSPMAVLFLRTVDARVSGVIYTRDPSAPKADTLLVSCSWGASFTGATPGDQFVLSRKRPHAVTERCVAHKEARLDLAPDGGLCQEVVSRSLADVACLSDAELEELAILALRAEECFGGAQDIEWALDEAGGIWLLQARPLHLEAARGRSRPRAPKVEPLLTGGTTVYPGQVSGVACVAAEPEELRRVPDGAIVLVRHTSPDFVHFLPRVGGLVVEAGNPAGHVAALVREFRVPTLFQVAEAVSTITDGTVVSLDAVAHRIYPGELFPAADAEVQRRRLTRKGPQRPLEARVTSLKLLDPKAWSFRPTHCRSVHDVVRFAHEKAIQAVFHLGDSEVEDQSAAIKLLESEVPIDFFVLDLGGGVVEGAETERRISPDQICSVPFRALWKGMSHPDVAWSGREYVSFSGFASVVARAITDQAAESRQLGAKSYVAIGANYVNLNSRLAYHYAMVDAVVDDSPDASFVNFRFKGGGADPYRKNLRARFLEECLRHYDYTVDVRQDLVNAWLKKQPKEVMEDRLDIVGRLMACSRQLDMFMQNEATMRWFVEQFLQGNYRFRVDSEDGPPLDNTLGQTGPT